LVIVVGLIVGLVLPVSAQQADCRFVLGFATLRDLVGPTRVGTCLEDEHFNLENGNAEQRTSGGLLVWRKIDNFTAFTDGGTTWVNGPNGLQNRPNAERFSWERNPVQTGSTPPTSETIATAPASPAPLASPAAQASPLPVATTASRPAPSKPATAAGGCHPSYPDFCIPPPPPDVNCSSPVIAGRTGFAVRSPDPHRLDQNGDGIGCEGTRR